MAMIRRGVGRPQGVDGSEAGCTDKTKITRKPSKTGKHGHEERKSTKEAGKSSQSQKVNLGQLVKSKGFRQLKGNMDYSREVVQDGRVKLVISKALISSLKQEGHIEEGKHKKNGNLHRDYSQK
ncbi:hypothetical protein Tco_0595628 [Tanacetum coccineum]